MTFLYMLDGKNSIFKHSFTNGSQLKIRCFVLSFINQILTHFIRVGFIYNRRTELWFFHSIVILLMYFNILAILSFMLATYMNTSCICVFKNLFTDQSLRWLLNMRIFIMAFVCFPSLLYLITKLSNKYSTLKFIIMSVELKIIFWLFPRFSFYHFAIDSYIIHIKINISFWPIHHQKFGMLLDYVLFYFTIRFMFSILCWFKTNFSN